MIESPVAAVRLRTSVAKRIKDVENATRSSGKTLLVVEQHFRKLNPRTSAPLSYDGVFYRDGTRAITPTQELRDA